MAKEEVILNIEKFVQFHRNRVSLLKGLAKDKSHGKLIYQISFLGFESLAKILYQKDGPGKRFTSLLTIPNMGVDMAKAKELWGLWRHSLFHQGFIAEPWTTLEAWSEYDIAFLSYPENKPRSSVEYPPESMIAIYETRIDYLEEFFKKTNTKQIEFNH